MLARPTSGDVEYSAYRQRRTFGSLDGLRALAVIAVVWQHTGNGGGLLARGYYGVDFFFAISGFLITTLLMREYSQRGRIDLGAFYIRRSLRIFPLYYAVLAIYVALVVGTELHTRKGEEFMQNLPSFLTYTSNWFVDAKDGDGVTFYFAWSLATEEQYYLLWAPLLFIALTLIPRGVWASAAALIGLAVIDAALSLQTGTHSFLWTVITSAATPILVGSLMALILHSERGFGLVAPVLSRWYVLVGLTAVIVALLWFDADRMLLGALMGIAVAALCVHEDHLLAPILKLKPLVYIGTISYGVYLLHMLASNLVQPVVGHHKGVVLFTATLAGALVLASISFRYFETPILRFKQRFERSSSGKRLPEANAAPAAAAD